MLELFFKFHFNFINILIYMLVGYIFGSIPNGYLYAKSKGVNIFEVGSKNPGSTNVGRVLGKKSGRIVFLLDILKTIIPIIVCAFFYYYVRINKDLVIFNIEVGLKAALCKYNAFNDLLLSNLESIELTNGNIRFIKLIVGLGAVIGHNFSIFTKFKGGKGITATVASVACFNIFYALVLFIIFKIFCKITNYVSLSSILSLIVLFLSSLFLTILNLYPFAYKYSELLPIVFFIYMAFGILRHSSNIKKLINGTENKIKIK